jgi:GT2 family glycosyltransferase
MTVIPNGYDADDFRTAAEALPANGTRDEFTIVHTGTLHGDSLYPARPLRAALRRMLEYTPERIVPSGRTIVHLLAALRRLRDSGVADARRVRIVLVGEVDRGTRRCIDESGVADAVTCTGFVDHAASVEWLLRADALFLPLHDLIGRGRSLIVPGKTYEYLAACKPILACLPDGDARDLISASRFGYLSRPTDEQGIADAIQQMLADARTASSERAKCEPWVQSYERRELCRQLDAFLRKIHRRRLNTVEVSMHPQSAEQSTEHPGSFRTPMPESGNISVVVPTFNRKQDLARLLESLWQQTVGKDQFEVIVANDGSQDGTDDVVRGFQDRPWRLTMLQLANRGPAAARNAGARKASGRYIAFTDDDCVAAPDWLERIRAAFERTGAVAIQGRTTTHRGEQTPLTHEIEVLGSWTSTVPTCNAAYDRQTFTSAGGFDESFPFAHNEDTDLAWRVAELGTIAFAPEVHIIHPPRQDGFLKRAKYVRIFQSDFLLYQKDPAKYRRYISRSPWWTIYWTVFVLHQMRFARTCCRYLVRSFQPRHFLVGIALLVARWIGLLWYFPAYWRAAAMYRSRA